MNHQGKDIFSGLNEKQAEAVRYTGGPLLILAGAGSGKTRVLVHRIAYLIREAGVAPWAILGITFTNKAAMEMKSRVAELLPDESSAIWISTFHSACARMLRRDIERIGFSRSFTIYDADDQLSLIKECLNDLNLSDKMFIPKTVLERISKAKDELYTSDDLRSRAAPPAQRGARSTQYFDSSGSISERYNDQIADIYELYQKKLKRLNALDFDDIILMAIQLLRECDDVREYYQNRFLHVLVDEYQDTNKAQYILISLLCGKWKNLCVVGDDDQSIYGWRGANIGNILGFEDEYSDAKVVKLEQNYRSTKTILSAANSVIDKNTRRKSKHLWTDNEDGDYIYNIQLDNEHEEAAYIARTLKKIKSQHNAGYNDFAVLYRINAMSRAMENIFIREGIPYRIIGGFKFFERKEIKDVVAYLRLIHNPGDNISFKRIINVPKRGIGSATINKLEAYASNLGKSMFETAAAVLNSPNEYPELRSAIHKFDGFIKMIRGIACKTHELGTAQILDSLLLSSGIAQMYKNDPSDEARARLENILEFKTEIIEFENSFEGDDVFYDENISGDAQDSDAKAGLRPGTSLEDFLTHVSLLSDIDNYDEEDDKVSLMTMHSAKGLEYDAVFIIGAEEGIFPGTRAISSPTQIEEERRLCYVAITRAKKRLFITNTSSRTIFGNTTYNMLSRFVDDIPNNIICNNADIEHNFYIKNNRDPHNTFYPFINKSTSMPSTSMPSTSISSGIPSDRFDSGRKYAVGDAVAHKKYGSGVIKARRRDGSDFIIEIDFENAGMKRFIESMVKLRVDD